MILAKKNLKKNDREKAKKFIIKRNKLQAFLDKRKKLMKTLENKINDIQNGANFAEEKEEIDNNIDINKDEYEIFKYINKNFQIKDLEENDNDNENEEINLELEKIIKEVSEKKKSKKLK